MFLCPQLCLLAIRAVFENKRAPKRTLKGHFFKQVKVPHNGIIKTLCAKNEVCKSISMTCSTYRRITKDKEENTRKWPKKGPQRAKNQNFEKQKIAFFSHVPRSTMPKNQVPRLKTLSSSGRTHTQTHRQTEISITEDTIRASVFKASASGMSGPINQPLLK